MATSAGFLEFVQYRQSIGWLLLIYIILIWSVPSGSTLQPNAVRSYFVTEDDSTETQSQLLPSAEDASYSPQEASYSAYKSSPNENSASIENDTATRESRYNFTCPSLCLCNGTLESPIFSIRCHQSGLPLLPTEADVTNLVVTGNTFVKLPNRFRTGFSNLRYLSLSNNSICDIEKNTFHDVYNLNRLDLSHNNLSYLHSTLLSTLNQLTSLNLSYNSLMQISGDIFSNLVHLIELDLSHNSILEIDPSAFFNNSKLEVLDLSFNQLAVLNASLFRNLYSLRLFSLRGNSFSYFEPYIFRSFQNLIRLDLSNSGITELDPNTFTNCPKLEELYLQDNPITYLPNNLLKPLSNLHQLNISGTLLSSISKDQLGSSKRLTVLKIRSMPRLEIILADSFIGFPNLQELYIMENPSLKYLHPNAFRNLSRLQILDLTSNSLMNIFNDVFIHLKNLQMLTLSNNKWSCDCGLSWLPQLLSKRKNLRVLASNESNCLYKPIENELPLNETFYVDEIDQKQSIFDAETYVPLNCSTAKIGHHTQSANFRIGSTGLLECQAGGNPFPIVTWITPQSEVLHWYPRSAMDFHYATSYKRQHPNTHIIDSMSMVDALRLHVLKNGNLFISEVMRGDAGTYTCLVSNGLGLEATALMTILLDHSNLNEIKVTSVLVGMATATAFMLGLLIYQLVQMLLNRWGWCCCRNTLPPKARQIRLMLESVEHYKRQQLERLHSNYTMQVQRIKDNCTLQLEKVRDNYTSQMDRFRDIRDYGNQQLDRLRDIRDYGSHQFDRLCDNYYEQVRRVRDYGTQRLNSVRENYVFQRNRIRKFSAHQLFKLRENYKHQQLLIIKILENMNLENCRGTMNGNSRSETIIFTPDGDQLEPQIPLTVLFPPELANIPGLQFHLKSRCDNSNQDSDAMNSLPGPSSSYPQALPMELHMMAIRALAEEYHLRQSNQLPVTSSCSSSTGSGSMNVTMMLGAGTLHYRNRSDASDKLTELAKVHEVHSQSQANHDTPTPADTGGVLTVVAEEIPTVKSDAALMPDKDLETVQASDIVINVEDDIEITDPDKHMF